MHDLLQNSKKASATNGVVLLCILPDYDHDLLPASCVTSSALLGLPWGRGVSGLCINGAINRIYVQESFKEECTTCKTEESTAHNGELFYLLLYLLSLLLFVS